jgi:hypothetical protein
VVGVWAGGPIPGTPGGGAPTPGVGRRRPVLRDAARWRGLDRERGADRRRPLPPATRTGCRSGLGLSRPAPAAARTPAFLAAGGPALRLVLLIGLGLYRAPARQVRDPLEIVVVAEAAAALVPVTLELVGCPATGLPAFRRPWFRNGLRRASRRAACTLRRAITGLVLRLPAVVLPWLLGGVVLRPVTVVWVIRRPLVLLSLRPSRAHEMGYP